MKFIPVYDKKRSARWHDVTLELPEIKEHGNTFLTVFRGESGFMAVSSWYKGKWYQGTHGQGLEWKETSLVTHWRELPEWPKL